MTLPNLNDVRPKFPGTRILATLGPASESREAIKALAKAGASAFRLNFSHGTHEQKRQMVLRVREVAAEIGRPLAILGDLCGPKLRTRECEGGVPLTLVTGQEIVITASDGKCSGARVTVDYAHLAQDVARGDRILFDDGLIACEVVRVVGGDVHARVLNGGPLSSRKGINLPGVRLSIPPFTERDAADLDFMMEAGVDLVALSFVREAADVVDLKRRVSEHGATIPVIAKIEKPEAVEHIEDILDVADGIMVARGDLGVEMSPEQVPVVQKRIIAAARRKSRLVITATQMLDSMTRNPRPTRAEASDVANAIFDGTDAVMLSAETASGAFPVESVATMAEIARIAKGSDVFEAATKKFHLMEGEGILHATVRAACVAAEDVKARAIIPFTASGWTAFLVAGQRPRIPVIACTYNPSAYQRLALCFGVTPVMTERGKDIDDLYVLGMRHLIEENHVVPGDIVIVVTGSVVRGSGANTIKIHRVGTADLSDDPETRRRLRELVATMQETAEDPARPVGE